MKIQIDFNLTDEVKKNWLTDAVECSGCIDYWADILKITRDEELNVIEIKLYDSETKKHYTVNFENIETGIQNMFNPNFKISFEIKQDILNLNADSTAVDCIIQAFLFNEIIYG